MPLRIRLPLRGTPPSELFKAVCCFIAFLPFFPSLLSAQTANTQAPRISQAIDPNRMTVLRGNRHPLAQAQFDAGAAPSDLPMQRMLLVLNRSAQQSADLEALLAAQQNKSSASYHRWLTPQQFGSQFGPADQDIQTITSWLQSQGFQVNRISNGRTVIEFSGTASQVLQAFRTEIHRYAVNGENHWANSADPQIPTALATVVAGIDALHNFPRHPMHYLAGVFSRSNQTGEITPLQPSLTLSGQCGVPNVGCHGVSPYDFATLYNLLPLWNASPAIDGTGQTIAIVGESDITVSDVNAFRTFFGLPAAKLQIIHDGPDPGIVPGDETESTLDVEWSGAVAKNATIDFVVSQSTETTAGVDLSAEYIVDNNLAPVLSVSYGECELALGVTGNQYYNQLWQQAAAQGITVFVSTGDSGSAVCDRSEAAPPTPATHGLSVSGFSSTPYNVAVGGTDFNDLSNASTYWGSTNTVPPNTPPGTPATSSALSYIPEETWNNSCTDTQALLLLNYSSDAETDCNNSSLVKLVQAVGGSGGRSNCIAASPSCTGGYPKPSWQVALTPSDSSRDLPDVSLFAAAGSPSGSFYVICEADQLPPGASSCNPAVQSTGFLAIGGTSASAPSFAGIMALVNQKTASPQGNANYVLYSLAQQQPGAFHDVSAGTIAMPCAIGSTNCITSHPGDTYGVLSGYAATFGYDLATGLGSIDASQLVNSWSTVNTSTSQSATTLTLNSGNAVNITHGQPVNVSINIAAQPPAAGTPTGSVSLVANVPPPGAPSQTTQQIVQDFALSNGSVSSSTNLLPGGAYAVFAQYPGDGNFSSSQSSPVSVRVAPESSQTSLAFELFSPANGLLVSQNASSTTFGFPSLLRMNVSSLSGATCSQNGNGQSGCATGSLALTDNGSPLDGGTFTLNNQGYAEDQTIQLLPGTHALKAIYAGDSSFTTSTATATVTITKAPTTITLGGPPNGIAPYLSSDESVVVLTQSVARQLLPTGTVQYFLAGAPLGAPVAVYGGFQSGFARAVAVAGTPLPVGHNVITAQYSGDSNFLASPISAPVTIHVLAPTNTALTASTGSTLQQGQAVTFTARVIATASGAPSPTGTVQFSVSAPSPLNLGGPVALLNGQAQLATTSLPAGLSLISAAYSGDANNVASAGSASVNVNPNFTISANPASLTIPAPGQSGSTVLTFAAQSGFSSNGNADISSSQCTGLPAETTCTFSPSTVSFPANGSATTTLTITTTASSQKVASTWKEPPAFAGWSAGNFFFLASFACLSLALLVFAANRSRWRAALCIIALATLFSAAGCGGGGGGSNNPGPATITDPGTPLGTSSVTVSVTINGSTETKNLQLVVQ